MDEITKYLKQLGKDITNMELIQSNIIKEQKLQHQDLERMNNTLPAYERNDHAD